jgi:hypothetical protein
MVTRKTYLQQKKAMEEATEIICQWLVSRRIIHDMSMNEQLRLFHRYLQRHKDAFTPEQRECMALILRCARIE